MDKYHPRLFLRSRRERIKLSIILYNRIRCFLFFSCSSISNTKFCLGTHLPAQLLKLHVIKGSMKLVRFHRFVRGYLSGGLNKMKKVCVYRRVVPSLTALSHSPFMLSFNSHSHADDHLTKLVSKNFTYAPVILFGGGFMYVVSASICLRCTFIIFLPLSLIVLQISYISEFISNLSSF